MRQLKESDRFSSDAVDRRFAAAATATSLEELSMHLRGLIAQIRSIKTGIFLDYSRLYWDLCAWQDAEQIMKVRRRWGSQYFTWLSAHDDGENSGESQEN